MAAAAPFVVAGLQMAKGALDRKDAYKASRVDDENARLAILSGEQDAEAVRRDERRTAGDIIAGASGGGFDASGSVGDILASSSYQAELDVLRARQKAYGEGRNYLDRAKDTRRAGDNALITGMFNAASTAISAVGQARRDRLAKAQGTKETSARLGGSAMGGK